MTQKQMEKMLWKRLKEIAKMMDVEDLHKFTQDEKLDSKKLKKAQFNVVNHLMKKEML